jgi:hypothetical protein
MGWAKAPRGRYDLRALRSAASDNGAMLEAGAANRVMR